MVEPFTWMNEKEKEKKSEIVLLQSKANEKGKFNKKNNDP